MGIQQKLHTKLVQKLILTPSLQQAIKLLPMSTLELSDLLNQEMVENPMLEEVPTEELQPAEAAQTQEKTEQVTASGPAVRLEIDGAIGRIKINKPKANLYDRQFMAELNDAVDEIRFNDDIKVVIVSSDLDKFFSAGADIPMLKASQKPKRQVMPAFLQTHENMRMSCLISCPPCSGLCLYTF